VAIEAGAPKDRGDLGGSVEAEPGGRIGADVLGGNADHLGGEELQAEKSESEHQDE
jgi:hypothetical protein